MTQRARFSVVGALSRLLPGLATLSARHPWMTLFVVTLLTVASVVAATRLHVKADLIALLPDDYESVEQLSHLEQRYGGLGYVSVVVRGEDPDALMAYADLLAPHLEALESVHFVDSTFPLDFFSTRALYFLDVEDLELIVRRVHRKESRVVGRNGEWTHLQRIEGQEGALRDRARRGQQQTERRDGDETAAVCAGEFTNRSHLASS